MLVAPCGSAEILLPASSRPVLLQLSFRDDVCASCTGSERYLLDLSAPNLCTCRHGEVRGTGMCCPWLASWV